MSFRASSLRKIGVAAVLAAASVVTSFVPAQAAPNDIVDIHEDGLRSCLASALGVAQSSPISEAQIASITGSFRCDDAMVSDLAPLQYATGITHLSLNSNRVYDLSPLANLTGLTELSLFSNPLGDLSPLSGLTNLTLLDVSSSWIADASPLAALTKLTKLDLTSTYISDISSLKDLTQLTSFGLISGSLEDISVLAHFHELRYLDLRGNRITDVSVLGDLKQLQVLLLNQNRITDISPVAHLPELISLLAYEQSTGSYTASIGETLAAPPAVIGHDGAAVELATTSGDAVRTADSITWMSAGSNALSWSQTFNFNQWSTAEFSGSVEYTVTDPSLTPAEDQAPSISGWAPQGVVGEPYSFRFDIAGSPAPTLEVVVGGFPGGLTLDANGTLRGRPVKAGTYSGTVFASNGVGNPARQNFFIVITDPTHTPDNGGTKPETEDTSQPTTPTACAAPRSTASFTDVPLTQHFFSAIDWMDCMHYTTGVRTAAGRAYLPKADLTREAMAAFLYRYAGSPAVTLPVQSPFADMRPGDPFYKEIVWMHQQGLSTGIAQPSGKPNYAPKAHITREAIAAFIYRYAAPTQQLHTSHATFVDMHPGDRFFTEITWMHEAGLSTGNMTSQGPAYWPKANLTREAMAAFLYRFAQSDISPQK